MAWQVISPAPALPKFTNIITRHKLLQTLFTVFQPSSILIKWYRPTRFYTHNICGFLKKLVSWLLIKLTWYNNKLLF